MMPKRWHHGHSLAAGALFGLAVASYRTWLLIAVAFVGGLAIGVLGPKLYRLGLRVSSLLASEMADFWRRRRGRMARERQLVAEHAEYARRRATT